MSGITQLYLLCRSEPEQIAERLATGRPWFGFCFLVTALGAGVYGATIGLWRAPLQALYTGIKFPLVMLLTTTGNALINGMLAQLLGLGISFRQSALAVFTSFALASVILASLAPVMLFLWMNTPPLAAGGDAVLAHNFTLLTHIAVIAFAGIMGNVRLLWLLRFLCHSHAVARRILLAWLAVNLFLGGQLSWTLRPFVGSPGLPVEFLRAEAFEGNFYESTWRAIRNLTKKETRP